MKTIRLGFDPQPEQVAIFRGSQLSGEDMVWNGKRVVGIYTKLMRFSDIAESVFQLTPQGNRTDVLNDLRKKARNFDVNEMVTVVTFL